MRPSKSLSPQDFEEKTKAVLDHLLTSAKKENEFAYVFSLLGINSGEEDKGWQPIAETYLLMRDFVSICNAPFHRHTKTRLLLLCYVQITEASYLYHVIYNMLVTIENNDPPKVFNFLDNYTNGIPPKVRVKVKKICEKASQLKQDGVKKILEEIFDVAIRNAVSHADYILHENELRIKHRGSETRKIPLDDFFHLVEKTISFFQAFFDVTSAHQQSYPEDYVISGRTRKNGGKLASINLTVEKGLLVGFSQSDPLPTW